MLNLKSFRSNNLLPFNSTRLFTSNLINEATYQFEGTRDFRSEWNNYETFESRVEKRKNYMTKTNLTAWKQALPYIVR